IDDKNLQSFSENHLRQTLSFVTQQLHIFNASVRDNLTLMRTDISDDACNDVLKRMQLDVNLDDPMGEFGKYFSGGQCRRIAIARALLYNTPILLLDEPTTGLEDGLFEKIWENCEDRLMQKTVVIATHNQAVLDRMDDVCHL
ncbi:MAG TPA: ATP-binding cassette domain-containing protein, partial [Coxiellaceae bacterium]|nr:ATP-binding cassette domain-containing protein [Coxiellaceae bacterium]